MKKIWYLREEKGQNIKAVKLFLYEKSGHITGRLDLAAFWQENSKDNAEITVVFQDMKHREIANLSFFQGKGLLKEELAEKLKDEKGEAALLIIAGKERYLSEDWQNPPAAQETEKSNQELETEELYTEEIFSEEAVNEETIPEELPQDTPESAGRRIVQLETLEEEMIFRRFIHNSFLIHGFYNYGHLVVDEATDGVRLGVPGNYYDREQMVAAMFGFPDFETARENDKIENGTFGYFYTKPQMPGV